MIEVIEAYENGLLHATVIGGKKPVEIVERAPYEVSFTTVHVPPRHVSYMVPRTYAIHVGGREMYKTHTDYQKAVNAAVWHARRVK
jgi:hypothetical protein